MKTQEVLAYIESGEDTAYGMFADLDPKIKKKFNKAISDLSTVIDEIRKTYPDACYLVGSDEISIVLADVDAGELINVIAHDSGEKLRGKIDGCGW